MKPGETDIFPRARVSNEAIVDSKLILSLVDKFNESGIAELDFDDGTCHLMLCKEAAGQADIQPKTGTAAGPRSSPRTPAKPTEPQEVDLSQAELDKILALKAAHAAVRPKHTPPSPAATGTGGAAAPTGVPGAEAVTSPIVATFYASPSPDAPPFVSVGSKVKKGETLCVLEAMKMMNKLEAEFDCKIVSIKAKSGDLVEFGQTLFEVMR